MVDDPLEYLGNLILLIVGGNDTTRNSITGGVVALNQHPDQFARLKAELEAASERLLDEGLEAQGRTRRDLETA